MLIHSHELERIKESLHQQHWHDKWMNCPEGFVYDNRLLNIEWRAKYSKTSTAAPVSISLTINAHINAKFYFNINFIYAWKNMFYFQKWVKTLNSPKFSLFPFLGQRIQFMLYMCAYCVLKSVTISLSICPFFLSFFLSLFSSSSLSFSLSFLPELCGYVFIFHPRYLCHQWNANVVILLHTIHV